MILDLQKAQQHLLNFRSLPSKHTISFKNLIWGGLWKIECSKRRETAAWCSSEALESTLQGIFCFKWFSFAALLVIFRYSVQFETGNNANLRRYMHLLGLIYQFEVFSNLVSQLYAWGFSFPTRDGKEHNHFEGLQGQSLLNRQANTSLQRKFSGNSSFLVYTHNWDLKKICSHYFSKGQRYKSKNTFALMINSVLKWVLFLQRD